MNEIKVLDVVSVLEDVPQHGLLRGQVGTVVELWKDGVFEVEFSDNSGATYAFAALPSDQLMKLHFRKDEAAQLVPERPIPLMDDIHENEVLALLFDQVVGERGMAEHSRLVVFDTNAIEQRYLTPLLRGETCRDFDRLRRSEYIPAFYVKSYYEICSHAKFRKEFPWMDKKLGYPGGIYDEGAKILREAPRLAGKHNLYWLFGLCEQWRDMDWEREAAKISALVFASDQAAALSELDVRRRFSEWKFALTGFCSQIWSALAREMKILTEQDLFASPSKFAEVFSLQQELASNSLIPNEDLEIVVAALANNAVAFVTSDEKILSCTALSVSLNYRTAFVHTEELITALESDFEFRWSPEQTRGRSSA
jgi:hypothetical protein